MWSLKGRETWCSRHYRSSAKDGIEVAYYIVVVIPIFVHMLICPQLLVLAWTTLIFFLRKSRVWAYLVSRTPMVRCLISFVRMFSREISVLEWNARSVLCAKNYTMTTKLEAPSSNWRQLWWNNIKSVYVFPFKSTELELKQSESRVFEISERK